MINGRRELEEDGFDGVISEAFGNRLRTTGHAVWNASLIDDMYH